MHRERCVSAASAGSFSGATRERDGARGRSLFFAEGGHALFLNASRIKSFGVEETIDLSQPINEYILHNLFFFGPEKASHIY